MRLTESDQRAMTQRYTENTEAYRLYLQGQYLASKRLNEATQNAAKRKLLAQIVGRLGQAERRIGKVERAVGAVDQVVGTVQPLAVVAIGQYCKRTVWFEPRDAVVAMLIDGQATSGIERKTVGARLAVLCDVIAGVTAGMPEHR